MIPPDRSPFPGRAPTPRRFTPDAPTRKISLPSAAPAVTAAAVGSAGTIAPGDQDGAKRFRLSVVQIVASTAAAVTAAVIGSRLGVAGTLTGAALASVVSAVGAAVYGHSLLVTRRQVTRALRLVRPAAATPSTQAGATPTASGAPVGAPSRPTVPGPDDDPTMIIARVAVPVTPAQRRSRRPLIVVLAAAVAAVLVFVASLATVTLLETVTGGPLSGGTGLSIQGGNPSPGTQPTTDPTTVTVTSTTSDPSATATATGTGTQTFTQSPTPSSTGSAGPTTAAPTSDAASDTGSATGSAPPNTAATAGAAGQPAASTAPTPPTAP